MQRVSENADALSVEAALSHIGETYPLHDHRNHGGVDARRPRSAVVDRRVRFDAAASRASSAAFSASLDWRAHLLPPPADTRGNQGGEARGA